MAKNTQPVLKRARTLGIEPGFMGIDRQSRRNPNQGRREKRATMQFSSMKSRKLSSYTACWKSSSEILCRRLPD